MNDKLDDIELLKRFGLYEDGNEVFCDNRLDDLLDDAVKAWIVGQSALAEAKVTVAIFDMLARNVPLKYISNKIFNDYVLSICTLIDEDKSLGEVSSFKKELCDVLSYCENIEEYYQIFLVATSTEDASGRKEIIQKDLFDTASVVTIILAIKNASSGNSLPDIVKNLYKYIKAEAKKDTDIHKLLGELINFVHSKKGELWRGKIGLDELEAMKKAVLRAGVIKSEEEASKYVDSAAELFIWYYLALWWSSFTQLSTDFMDRVNHLLGVDKILAPRDAFGMRAKALYLSYKVLGRTWENIESSATLSSGLR